MLTSLSLDTPRNLLLQAATNQTRAARGQNHLLDVHAHSVANRSPSTCRPDGRSDISRASSDLTLSSGPTRRVQWPRAMWHKSVRGAVKHLPTRRCWPVLLLVTQQFASRVTLALMRPIRSKNTFHFHCASNVTSCEHLVCWSLAVARACFDRILKLCNNKR